MGNIAWQLSSFSLAGFFPFCRIILSRPFRPASARDFGGGRRWRRRMDCVLASRYSVRFASHGGVLFRLSCRVAYLRALRSAGSSAWVLVAYHFLGGRYVGAGGVYLFSRHLGVVLAILVPWGASLLRGADWCLVAYPTSSFSIGKRFSSARRTPPPSRCQSPLCSGAARRGADG